MRLLACLLALLALPAQAGISRPHSIVVSDLPPPRAIPVPVLRPYVLVPAPQSSVTEAHGACLLLREMAAVVTCLAEQDWKQRAQ